MPRPNSTTTQRRRTSQRLARQRDTPSHLTNSSSSPRPPRAQVDVDDDTEATRISLTDLRRANRVASSFMSSLMASSSASAPASTTPPAPLSKSEQMGMDAPAEGVVRDADTTGMDLIGREILICWTDGRWYDAVVVRYYPELNEYKLVYRADDGVEILNLDKHRWTVAPKKSPLHHRNIVDGAIIRFIYPHDGKAYYAMVYDANQKVTRIKVAYIEEYATDILKGGGWEFVTKSPCIEDVSAPNTEELLHDATEAIKKGNENAVNLHQGQHHPSPPPGGHDLQVEEG